MKTLGLVVPCFNEQDVLELFYTETIKVIASLSGQYACELVFVDDGSTDNTLNIMKGLAMKDPAVKYISFSRNFGKEAAMLAGMKYTVRFDYTAILDADLQHSPDLIPEMLRAVEEEGYDVAAAKRTDRTESGLTSKLSGMFYGLINAISDTKINNSAQDFRVMSKKVVEAVLSLPENNRFSKGIFAWVGFNVKWIEHADRERAAGQTKWSFRKLLRYALDGIMGFTYLPLRISYYCSVLFGFITVLSLVYALVRKIVDPAYSALPPLFLAAMFFIGAVILLVLGILGAYLSRVYTEAKGRPAYIISQTNTRQTFLDLEGE